MNKPLYLHPTAPLEPAVRDPRPDIGFSGDGFEHTVATLGDTLQAKLVLAARDEVIRAARSDTTPIPVPSRREAYFGEDDSAYWLSGFGDRLFVMDILKRNGLSPGSFFDLGCASGRFLRHMATAGFGRLLGSDINAQHVDWCRTHLSGATVFTNLVCPPLPLEQDSLDVVTAFSVFTHINEFEEAWLLEIRRVLRVGGLAVITIHPERAWNRLADQNDFMRNSLLSNPQRIDGHTAAASTFDKPMPGNRVVVEAVGVPVYNTNVFVTHDYVTRHWGEIFEIVDIVPRAHGEHQDALVLRKPR